MVFKQRCQIYRCTIIFLYWIRIIIFTLVEFVFHLCQSMWIRLYPTLNINNRNFKRTRQFKYLGSILSEKNEIEIEIGTRIQSGNKCLYGLAKLLGSRSLSRELKLQLYITLIRPVITYGAEAWPLRKSDERKLLVLERKILKKIFGPVKDIFSGEWRIRKNDELETLFHKPTGHAWRSQNPLIRMVLEENPNGKRPLGRPRRRWEDGVRDDVKALGGGEDWRLQVSNRENWRQGCMSGWS
ncbi:MICOS complex subunit Mic60-like [Aphis craccivora]|uniref:MICOS complex subunit Mic60-like n=1 Tax=Aphis craccivora TaxID=307492 RepID=A0A6G0VW80_APHCR|nr:MICOS complex subunit Mic60-like [Aphis craccivora]